jgi:Domain of unknown function (DUF6431)
LVRAWRGWRREQALSVLRMIVEPGVVEADLAAGRLCCPGCEGPLARWGFARERQVRMLDGVRTVKPRRAYCQRCEATHVLLPAWAVPRRRDGAEVIGEALLDKAQGLGHRGIAARLARPPGTVRGWLRAFARRAESVSSCARGWTHAIDSVARCDGTPPGSPLAEAVEAIGSLHRAYRLGLRRTLAPWELAVALTGLLHGESRDPPGF